MIIRVTTGILLAIAVTCAVIFLPLNGIKIAVAIVVALGCFECARMILPDHPTTSRLLPTLLGTGLSILILFGPKDFSLVLMGITSVLIITFAYYLFLAHSLDFVIIQVSRTFFITIYFGVMFSFLGLIRELPEGWPWLLLILATTFGADTGAFFSGKFLGRHKLAPRVSPGKTIEGLLGGLIISIALAFASKYLFFNNLSIDDCLWIGGLVGLIGPIGDLAESLLKRSVGVKDSGNLIPGHGGILDRVDALLFTSPMIYWYVLYIR